MKRVKLDVTLTIAAIGLGCLAVGAGLVYLPLSLLVLGAGFVLYAVFLSPDSHGGPTP